jgi:hypothetical protein
MSQKSSVPSGRQLCLTGVEAGQACRHRPLNSVTNLCRRLRRTFEVNYISEPVAA